MTAEIKHDLLHFRREAEKNEAQTLNYYAAKSQGHTRYFGPDDDHRLPYKRDVDRIVHSKAYSRYVDKTQVAYLIDNDHISHRSLHVQLVSNFSRGIAEILRLNLDLVEAIALGHDVGHPPFGHEGEGYLSQISEDKGLGPFSHPWQSCRLFREIEPLNLGLAVVDGFLCHDGAMHSTKITPGWDKTWDDHFKDLEAKFRDPDVNLPPATLEGCLVKLCDTLSYVGRDLEDAICLGIVERSEIPETCLGNSNREILTQLAQDVIGMSYGKEYIAISDEAYEALKQLRAFNFERIYSHEMLKVESEKIQKSYNILFNYLLTDFEQKKKSSYLWLHFVHNKTAEYQQKTNPSRMVVDFIAGMTDGFFIQTLKKLFLPSTIELGS